MRTDEGQDGFTVLELLLSITILGVIMGAITTALIVFLENGRDALERDDHSGGAAIASSYLDRDVASADAVSVPGGSECSGSTNLATLRWQQWNATPSAPEPAPAGDPYISAYVVTVDGSSVPPDGSTRYKLERVHCQGTTVLDRATLVPNLPTPFGSATAALTSSSSCPSGQALAFSVAPHSTDTTDPYVFASCTETRLTP